MGFCARGTRTMNSARSMRAIQVRSALPTVPGVEKREE